METVSTQPDAAKIIESLRDTGYLFETAIADIVDNSVDAGATSVDIKVLLAHSCEITVSIADNGRGMNRNELINAMRYGSTSERGLLSLGKYGLGLKTASTAFSRKLSLTSRKSSSDKALTACWDLDLIQETNTWDLQMAEAEETAMAHLNEVAPDSSGTVVVWNKVDRILNHDQYQKAEKARNNLLKKLQQHLGKVFQRFLDPSHSEVSDVSISVNGQAVVPWDPFATNISELIREKDCPVELIDGTAASFTIKAYILPHKNDLDPEQRKLVDIKNKNQGIYIYRHGRLIQDASWLGEFVQEPHLSLLRVNLSFDHRFDSVFNLDIRKSQINLNEGALDFVKAFLGPPRMEAEKRYRRRLSKDAVPKNRDIHKDSNQNIDSVHSQVKTPKMERVKGEKDTALLTNIYGSIKIHIPTYDPIEPGEIYVRAVDNLKDGLLFEPALIKNKNAVEINTNHDYYQKVYIPNQKESVTIQGMDALLWALCVAELSATSGDTLKKFKEMRHEVSWILSQLVTNLPDPDPSLDESDKK